MNDDAQAPADASWSGYLDRLAARVPAPGVGAAAARTAAMAAAVVEMALARGPDRHAAERDRNRAHVRALRDRCSALAEEDALAVARWLKERSPTAQARATEVPCALAEACASIDVQAARALHIGNPLARMDALGAQRLARAALAVARDLAHANLAGLEDADTRRVIQARLAVLQGGDARPAG